MLSYVYFLSSSVWSDTIYPIRIIKIANKDIWINRGNDSGMKVGEILEVFQPGEQLIDPDTGEDLGTTEAKVGTVKVVRINPKASIVKSTNKNLELEEGYILRRPGK